MINDPLVLRTVLLLIGVPRMLFVLADGAVVDRHSPKPLVSSGDLQLGMMNGLSVPIGISTACRDPSATTALPYVIILA